MQVRMCTQMHTYTHYARTHIRGSPTQRICATNLRATQKGTFTEIASRPQNICPSVPQRAVILHMDLMDTSQQIRPFLIEVALAKVICIRPSISVSAPETPSAQKQNRNRAILKGLSQVRGC